MRKRKYLCGMLAALMTLTVLVLPVSAIDVNETSTGGTATVSYNNDSTWTAAIPTYVAPNNVGQQNVSDYKVSVQDVVIGDNQQLAATIEYSGYVTEENGVRIPYQLYDSTGKEIQSGDTVLSKSAGEPTTEIAVTFGAALTDTPKYAGVYTDTATFSFAENEKVYTLDEINADEHMFAIGETQPEYVVAKFNDDFSAVTIFANGENSDGLMKNFGQFTDLSPMVQHTSELETVQFKAIKNIGDYAFNGCWRMNCTLSFPETLTAIGKSAFSQAGVDIAFLPENLVSIGDYAFWTTNVHTVHIPKNVTKIGVRSFPVSLISITVDPENNSFCDIDGVLFNKEQTELILCPGKKGYTAPGDVVEYTIPETVNSIAPYAFHPYGHLTVTVPGTVKTIKTNTFSGLYSHVIFSEGVERIEKGAFNGSFMPSEITIPESLTEIDNSWFIKSGTLSTKVEKVYGVAGSYAETWAAENGYSFIAQ